MDTLIHLWPLFVMAVAQPKDDAEFTMAVLDASLSNLEAEVREIKVIIKDSYVTRMDFDPVKSVVYGLTGVVLIGAIAALVVLVLRI